MSKVFRVVYLALVSSHLYFSRGFSDQALLFLVFKYFSEPPAKASHAQTRWKKLRGSKIAGSSAELYALVKLERWEQEKRV